jgi:hypothetical protein
MKAVRQRQLEMLCYRPLRDLQVMMKMKTVAEQMSTRWAAASCVEWIGLEIMIEGLETENLETENLELVPLVILVHPDMNFDSE